MTDQTALDTAAIRAEWEGYYAEHTAAYGPLRCCQGCQIADKYTLDLLAEVERGRTADAAESRVVESALRLREAETDDEITEAWADFDQAVDDYKEQLEEQM